MIAGLSGVVRRLEADGVVLDVQGVMYRVHVTTRLLQDGVAVAGHQLQLDTHLIVREDAMTLYGFQGHGEVTWFKVLLGINGVGPRVALAMMSRFTVDEMVSVVSNEDVSALASVPGIGKKTASRIVLDLIGKIPTEPSDGTTQGTYALDEELIDALQGLGYTRGEALDAASKVDVAPDGQLEERLLSALRALSPAS